MDVEDLVKSYFRLGFSNKEILCLLAHQHAVIISKRTLQQLCRNVEKIRQTLRKLPLCAVWDGDQWSTPRISMVTSACYSKRICCFSRGWWSKKSTLKELNFGALDVSEYAIMPQRVGTPAEVLATSSAPKFNWFFLLNKLSFLHNCCSVLLLIITACWCAKRQRISFLLNPNLK